MVRRFYVLTLALPLLVVSCGKKAPPKDAENASGEEADAGEASGDETAPSDSSPKSASSADPITGEKTGEKKSCEGLELDLVQVLSQASCESEKPLKDVETKDKLDIKVAARPNVVPKGGKATIMVTFTNKTKAPMPLYFTVDPDPRFQIEVYDKKTSKRVDAPTAPEPRLPDSVAQAAQPESKVARATLVTAGTGVVKIDWSAVKYKWSSPERAKGAIPGRGYPKEAAGPLPKGHYIVKVIMPMVGVFEGLNREVSVQQAEVEVQ